jgi:hypothetical protein
MSALLLTCPKCATQLKLLNPLPPGHGVKCPKCATVFQPPPGSPARPAPSPPAAAAPKPAPAPRPVAPAKAPAAARPKPAPPKPAAPGRPALPKPKPPPPDVPEEILELTPDARPEPPRRAPKKAGTGKCIVVVLVLLFLFCGGVVGAGALVGVYFLHQAQQLVAQATMPANHSEAPVPGSTARPEARPPESKREDVQPPPRENPPVEPVPAKPAVAPLDVTYVAPDFKAAIVLHGSRLAKSPVVSPFLRMPPVTEVLKQVAVEPDKIERAIVLIQPFPGGNVAFLPAGIVRFTEPVNGKQLLGQALQELQEATFRDKVYYTSKSQKMAGLPVAGYVADDRTLLVALEPTLRIMLSTGNSRSALGDQLRQLDLDADVVATGVVDGLVREGLAEALKQGADQLPPPLAGLKTVPEHLTTTTLSLNLARDPFLSLVLEMDTDEAAVALEDLARKGHSVAKDSYADLQKEMTGQLPPDLALPVSRAGSQLLDNINISRDGKRVVVQLKTPQGLPALADKLSALGTSPEASAPPPPPKPLPKVEVQVTAMKEARKGDTRSVMDVRVTALRLEPNLLGCTFWEDPKGTTFLTLDPTGMVRRLTFPDLEEIQQVKIGKKCSWLSPSAEGPLLSVIELEEVWVLDPQRFEVKQRIALPGLKRAVSAPTLAAGFATNGRELYELDLRKGTARPFSGPGPKFGGWNDPVPTPDGKYLFTRGDLEDMHRFAIADGRLRFEQSSPRIAQGRVDIGIQVSPDSKRVCLPCYAGNYGAGKYGAIFVYPVTNIEKAEFVLDPGAMAVGFDPVTGYLYGQALRLYSQEGKLLHEYMLGGGDFRQNLVHPEGNRFLLLQTDRVSLVEVPKK